MMNASWKPLCVGLVLMATMWLPVSAWAQDAAKAVKLEQIISREDPAFNCTGAVLDVGRDGNVYVGSAGHMSYAIRLSPDGKTKAASALGAEALRNVTANADGVIAGAHAHFAASMVLYDTKFQVTHRVAAFLVGDNVGWEACAHVDVGASGDFYAMDQYRNRVLRITPQAKIIKEIPTGNPPGGDHWSKGVMHAVCEKTESLYVLTFSGTMRCLSFDGTMKWQVSAQHVNPHDYTGGSGGFDVDDDGTLYVMKPNETVVRMYDPDGKPAGEIKLNMGEHGPVQGFRISSIAVRGDEIFVKRLHPTELFQRYDKATGERRNIVYIEHERLSVEYPGDVWTAGQTVDFRITFDGGDNVIKPAWKIWARSFGDTNWRELAWKDNKLSVPADLVGVVHVKVSPEVQPRVRGRQSEYLVQSLVAVVKEGTHGTVVVTTENNRLWYGRGEAISVMVHSTVPGAVLGGSGEDDGTQTITLRLVTDDGKTLASGKGIVAPAIPRDFLLPADLTRALAPGRYRLEVDADGMTCVGKSIEIGPGMGPREFRTIRYGDYNLVFPLDHGQSVFDATDSTANYLSWLNRMGINFLSDRMGWGHHWTYFNQARGEQAVKEMAKRLSDAGVMPAAAFGYQTQYLQLLSGYSAYNIEQMPVLLCMDAGLPVGTGYDGRKMDQVIRELQHATKVMSPFPAFTGWIYGNNWWVYDQRGADAARNDDATNNNPNGTMNQELRAAYLAAEKEARETGKWNPVLDQVAERRWTLIRDASNIFRSKVEEIVTGKTSSAGGPYRNFDHYAPISHRDMDVVDMQAQFEQVSPPYTAPHAVDIMRRPGKPVLSHPEIYGDGGTGGLLLPVFFMVAMRGSDSVGFSGGVPQWGTQAEDSRLGDTGYASVYRAVFNTLRTYGPWLVTLKNNDRVAILVERRMQTIDVWDHEIPRHFIRHMEAYVSCLHAHHPATFVFAEEATPETLAPFKALLLVDQQVELEPSLKEKLEAAIQAGTTVFYDKTCRESMMPQGAKPLDVAFDKFSSKGHQAGDDAVFLRFSAWAQQNVPALSAALGAVAAPVATTDNPEILMSERTSGSGRYLWVVNNTTPDLDPGLIWRVTLIQATRVPVVANIKLNQPTGAIYDVFAGKRVELKNGAVDADLRTLPARLYAMLDEPIAGVNVEVAGAVYAGGTLVWTVSVLNKDGKPLSASVPVRVRFFNAAGAMLEERIIAALGRVQGKFTHPLGVSMAEWEIGTMTIEATELFSGITVQKKFGHWRSTAGTLSDKDDGKWLSTDNGVMMNAEDVTGTKPSPSFTPAEQSFGPHLRNLVISADGKTVLMNAMNWDENLYAVNVADGKTLWSKKVGHYFAFAPQAFGGGFAVQGYDLTSAQGYHLYTMDAAAGTVDKRFALYGLPKRLPHRFVVEILGDKINNFVAPADGSWIASSGDMGLVVWTRDGKVLFQQDWHKTERHTAKLAVLDNQTLLVVEGLTATAYTVADGKQLWQVKDLAPTGGVRQVVVSRDGKTVALLATCQGGRVFVIRDGQLLRTLPTASEEGDFTADGSRLAITIGNQLKLYSIAEGLQWIYGGDASMRQPRFSPDAKRIVVTTDLGTVYVLDPTGDVLMERDFDSKTMPAWLDNGDLLLATWMGKVIRLNNKYEVAWERLLQPATSDIITRLLAEDKTPTVQMSGWTNSTEKPLALDVENNLLAKTKPFILFVPSGTWGGVARLQHSGALLYDGKLDPPPTPWLDWANVGFFAETSPINYLLIDAWRTNMKVSAVTLVEDKSRPESWLRDASLEYWDVNDELWKPAVKLLSDAPVHSHKLPQPIEAARWRIMMPRGLVGNLRLGEIIFHGELGGNSHPDVMAKKPVAELFDERNDLADSMAYGGNGFSFDLKSAWSGNRSIRIEPRRDGRPTEPQQREGYGHTIQNWDFEIVENPADGQYRYAQFAWKAGDEKTTGINLRLFTADSNLITFLAGSMDNLPGTIEKISDTVPADWTVVRVDLWKLFGKPVRIRAMTLGATGGPACFDQILLGKTEEASPKSE